MLKIRLRRMGSTHRPFYRVVVSDSRRTPTSRAVEEIGFYNPRGNKELNIDLERLAYWQSQGAQPSKTVRKLARRQEMGPAEAPAPAEAPKAEEPKAEEAVEAVEAVAEAVEAAAEEAPADAPAEAAEGGEDGEKSDEEAS